MKEEQENQRQNTTESEKTTIAEIPKIGHIVGEEGKEIDIPDTPERPKEEEENDKKPSELEKIKDSIQKSLNLKLIRPEIEHWILERLKDGPTIIIGEKVGKTAELFIEKVNDLKAYDTSDTFVSPNVEVNNRQNLDKFKLTRFRIENINEIEGNYTNIILFFGLKKQIRAKRIEILKSCKSKLNRDGQIILADEFFPKNILYLLPAYLLYCLNYLKAKIQNINHYHPILRIEKTAKKLELKFYDTTYFAGGRVRIYIFSKRWGALVK